MSRTYKIVGIVLKRVNYNETDKIISIYTKEYGKILLLAKGVRKINSRKAPHLEPFSLIKAFVAKGKTWDIITEVETVSGYFRLRKDLKRIAYAYQIAEIIDRLCLEQEVSQVIFEQVKKIFDIIDKNNYPEIKIYLDLFYLNLLWELGYLPRENTLTSSALETYLQQIMEKKIRSKALLDRLS